MTEPHLEQADIDTSVTDCGWSQAGFAGPDSNPITTSLRPVEGADDSLDGVWCWWLNVR